MILRTTIEDYDRRLKRVITKNAETGNCARDVGGLRLSFVFAL